MKKRLVLLVEGEGEVEAAPALVKRLLSEQDAFDAVFLDSDAIRVGGYSGVRKNDFHKWKRLLAVAAKRKNIGGCLLILDGDCKTKKTESDFCAVEAARTLARHAREAGAGRMFSAAVVFACKEYESWLIAGLDSLAGKALPDGRAGVNQHAVAPDGNLEVAPRDAKGWLRRNMATGYSPTRDQAILTSMVDLNAIRNRPMRSFIRLGNAISQIVDAVRSGDHVVSPVA